MPDPAPSAAVASVGGVPPGARRTFTRLRLIFATLVVIGVFVQVYLITANVFGAADALDAHRAVGNAVHSFETLAFLAALVASWRSWGAVGLAFLLPLVGTIQIALADREEIDASGWVHGLHGLLALVVMVIATVIAHRDALALRAPQEPPAPER